jgi:hypothetical protein
MSYLIDALSDEQLTEFKATDSYTKRSYEEYAGESEVDEFDGSDDYEN